MKFHTEWLKGVLTEQFAGSGLRPEIEWREAHYLYSIVCPLEWKVTNRLYEDNPLPRMRSSAAWII